VELTKRQQEILRVVEDHIERHGYPPTVREIGDAVGLTSSSTVHAHLQALENRGALKRDPAKPRALDLARRRPARAEGGDVRVLPLLGRIAAGAPILAEEHVEEHVAVPGMLTSSGDCFLLRVRGESMIEAGILDGDYVVVRRQDDCEEGEIVAALVDASEATVKRLHRVAGRVRLSPENSTMEPFYPDAVQVLGKVVGVFRRL
jgi:repressor LexA